MSLCNQEFVLAIGSTMYSNLLCFGLNMVGDYNEQLSVLGNI